MHTDDGKTFDKRNIESNVRRGILSRKDLEAYVSRLPDVSDKIFNAGEDADEGEGPNSGSDREEASKKKGGKRKGKGQ